MKVLANENTPKLITDTLSGILRGKHEVKHVIDLEWRETKDVPLIRKAVRKGFEVILTADGNQLIRPDELRALRDSQLHHVRFDQHGKGLAHVACMIATAVAGMPPALEELVLADRQEFVQLKTIRPSRDLYTMSDRPPNVSRRRS